MAYAVQNFATKTSLLAQLTRTFTTKRLVALRALIFLLFLGVPAGAAQAGTDVQPAPATSPGPGLPFAIADFDGDFHPDLASIQSGPNNSGSANYSIQLQLTTTGLLQSIQLIAPAGGLSIAARDVNGDGAIDLVLTTAWLRQPVAIFLNDGHGTFSRVEPADFPKAFSQPASDWGISDSCQAMAAVGVPPQSRSGICLATKALQQMQPCAASISQAAPRFFQNQFLLSHTGRAPPLPVVLS